MDETGQNDWWNWLIGIGVLITIIVILAQPSGGGMAGLGYQELFIILTIIGIPLLIVLAFGGGGPTYQLNQWAPLAESRIRDHALR